MMADVVSTPPTFIEPRFHAVVDVEEQARLLPPNAQCKGMYFADMFYRAKQVDPRADLFRIAGMAPKRFVPFLDYPHVEWMRLAAAAASVVRPGRMSEGLRELGKHAYDVLFGSPLGKVLFGPYGFDLDQVLINGAVGWRLGLSFGQVSTRRLGPRHYRFAFRDMPTFLDSYNVGVIDGAIRHYGGTPRILVAMEGFGACEMDITWT